MALKACRFVASDPIDAPGAALSADPYLARVGSSRPSSLVTAHPQSASRRWDACVAPAWRGPPARISYSAAGALCITKSGGDACAAFGS